MFDPNVIGFWEFCRWVSKALLGVLAALAGIYLEVSGQEMVSYFTKFAVNRVSTAFFYCWMGFYLMGTDYGADSGWAALMKFTGAIAWAVAFGDLMISCTSQGLAELQPKPVPDSSVASASKNLAARSASYLSDHVLCAMKSSKGVGIASASNQLDLGGAADIESGARALGPCGAAPSAGAGPAASSAFEGAEKTGQATAAAVAAAAEGGWNATAV